MAGTGTAGAFRCPGSPAWALAVAAVALLTAAAAAATNEVSRGVDRIDLPTALRLAGAQNLDVQIARERLVEARANHQGAVAQFFPWLAPGAAYRRHEGRVQAVDGTIFDADKQSYVVGGALTAQLDIGEAIYKSLAAKQLVRAADHAFAAQQQEAILGAAQGYFDLAFGQAAVNVAKESVRISSDYENQVGRAVEGGIAFRGDQLRIRVQTERNQLALRQAEEQQRLAGARLAQTLHLDAAVQLAVGDTDLAPLDLPGSNATVESLVREALTARPELKQSQALVAAARDAERGVLFGPMVPSLGAQAFVGGLGGGRNDDTGNFGDQQEYAIGLNWRIGPGGLFDFSRRRAAASRLQGTRLTEEKIRDEIGRQVVEAFTRMRSTADQLETARRALRDAEEGLRLAQTRQEFAVGVVLENIQAEQDLTRARLDYFKTVAEFNKAQYALTKAVGKLLPAP
jgi:outer membrane protein TolC